MLRLKDQSQKGSLCFKPGHIPKWDLLEKKDTNKHYFIYHTVRKWTKKEYVKYNSESSGYPRDISWTNKANPTLTIP